MTDRSYYENNPDHPWAPSRNPFAIEPHATNALVRPTKAIYVGGAGNVVLRALGGDADVTLESVPAGTILPIAATHIRATSTATKMVGLG